jgi:hypothetical protein
MDITHRKQCVVALCLETAMSAFGPEAVMPSRKWDEGHRNLRIKFARCLRQLPPLSMFRFRNRDEP